MKKAVRIVSWMIISLFCFNQICFAGGSDYFLNNEVNDTLLQASSTKPMQGVKGMIKAPVNINDPRLRQVGVNGYYILRQPSSSAEHMQGIRAEKRISIDDPRLQRVGGVNGYYILRQPSSSAEHIQEDERLNDIRTEDTLEEKELSAKAIKPVDLKEDIENISVNDMGMEEGLSSEMTKSANALKGEIKNAPIKVYSADGEKDLSVKAIKPVDLKEDIENISVNDMGMEEGLSSEMTKSANALKEKTENAPVKVSSTPEKFSVEPVGFTGISDGSTFSIENSERRFSNEELSAANRVGKALPFNHLDKITIFACQREGDTGGFARAGNSTINMFVDPAKNIGIAFNQYMRAVLHETGHVIDFALSPEQSSEYNSLHQASGSDSKNYARKYGMYGGHPSIKRMEDFATMFEAYTCKTKAVLDKATGAEDSNLASNTLLEKVKFMAQLFAHEGGDGKTYTYIFEMAVKEITDPNEQSVMIIDGKTHYYQDITSEETVLKRAKVELGKDSLPIIPSKVNWEAF